MTDDETKVLVPEELKTVTADDRGRAYLGSEHADSEVRVAILESEPIDDE